MKNLKPFLIFLTAGFVGWILVMLLGDIAENLFRTASTMLQISWLLIWVLGGFVFWKLYEKWR